MRIRRLLMTWGSLRGGGPGAGCERKLWSCFVAAGAAFAAHRILGILPVKRRPLGQFLAVEIGDDSRDVGVGLMIRRHAMIAVYPPCSGVIGGQRLGQIAIVLL